MEARNPGKTLREASNLTNMFELNIQDVNHFSSYQYCLDKPKTAASVKPSPKI